MSSPAATQVWNFPCAFCRVVSDAHHLLSWDKSIARFVRTHPYSPNLQTQSSRQKHVQTQIILQKTWVLSNRHITSSNYLRLFAALRTRGDSRRSTVRYYELSSDAVTPLNFMPYTSQAADLTLAHTVERFRRVASTSPHVSYTSSTFPSPGCFSFFLLFLKY